MATTKQRPPTKAKNLRRMALNMLVRSIAVRWWIPGSPHRAWRRVFSADSEGLTRAKALARMAIKRGRAYASWYITETIPE